MMEFDKSGVPTVMPKAMDNYMQSKIGSAWLAVEFGRRLGGSAGKNGVLCVVSSFVWVAEWMGNANS